VEPAGAGGLKWVSTRALAKNGVGSFWRFNSSLDDLHAAGARRGTREGACAPPSKILAEVPQAGLKALVTAWNLLRKAE